MTEQKHTPGPWGIAGKGTIRSHNGRGSLIAKVHWVNRDADARLILAAPELLAEVKDWLRDSDGWSVAELRKRYDEKTVQRILRSRAAIAKAEGKE